MTESNDRSVAHYIASLDDEQTIKDSETLIEMMQRISGHAPTLWNVGTIGFGTYHYRYDSGREGDGHTIGFGHIGTLVISPVISKVAYDVQNGFMGAPIPAGG